MNIEYYLGHAVRQIDHVERRLLKGETIPQDEKVFSIFESHTRWISKGKAGTPVELGVPVCVLEDNHGFILHHEGEVARQRRGLCPADDPGDPGTLPRASLVQLRPWLPQSRKQARSRRASGSQCAAPKRISVEGWPGPRTGSGVCRHAPSASGDRIGYQQSGASGSRPGPCLRRRWLCPRGGAFHRRLQHPPHRLAAAPKDATTTRRLTAPSE